MTGADGADLVASLQREGVTDVDASALARAMYASDASLYRVLPLVVVRPRHVDELDAALAVCRSAGVPLTMRGAGTSIAGNAVGPGVVADTSRWLHQVLALDPEARTATVQPGTVHATLQRQAARHGLRFGPDPSTHTRCTVGGMVGNNACGTRALAYGRTSDTVLALQVTTGRGERLDLPAAPATSTSLQQLQRLVGEHLAAVRRELGRFGRQGSGYALEHLLPERGFDVARALVGSEGTLAVVRSATVRLVAEPAARRLVVLGFPSVADAADAVPAVLPLQPTACEGFDERIARRATSRTALPPGPAWLLVEVTGAGPAEADAAAQAVAALRPSAARTVTDDDEAAALWRVREDGAGLASVTADGRPAHSGWEDAAVPPERLGSYLRGFDALLAEHGLTALPYGHFGDGCVHARVDVPLTDPDGPARFRAFLDDAAALTVEHGGSLSGEHGDGRARSGLLGTMYSPEVLDLFAAVKAVLDPDDVLNPGVLVRPRAPEQDLRLASLRALPDGLAQEVHRCIGVAACRADLTGRGQVMCPSFVATQEEKDSTRGRARVLQELAQRSGEVRDWDDPAVHEALDLCLMCKGCSRDCPTGVDMATWKAQVLHETYRTRPRPLRQRLFGALPDLLDRGGRWAAWAGAAGSPVVRRLTGRSLPPPVRPTFRDRFEAAPSVVDHTRPPVVLWLDTFTDHLAPQVGEAAVAALTAAGYRVQLPPPGLCCGLTWFSTGDLDGARRRAGAAVDALLPLVAAGTPVVGLEPSCTASLRSDAVTLLGTDAARTVAAGVRTLAELLTATPGWSPPRLDGVEVVAQPHCHHHAVMGWEPDAALLAAAGAHVTRVGGCCGLAGHWGLEPGHQEVSRAIAEHALLPAVRGAGPEAVVLADGFSCRTQLANLGGVRGRHLAELLREG